MDVDYVKRSVRYLLLKWNMVDLYGSLQNVKCVLDACTDVHDLPFSMEMAKQRNMDNIQIRIQKYRKGI